jgi:hypothetical protein
MTTRNTTRRAVLVGAAALPVLAVPAIAAATERDPIFAAIEHHLKSAAAWTEINSTLDIAECEAAKKHGLRPYELITWRDYLIGGSEIDQRRDALLCQPGTDRKQIEREYLDAKERERALIKAGIEWDNLTGIAPLREQAERATDADDTAAMTMARTSPRTPAGAGALIAYILKDAINGGPEWHEIALATTAAALQSMMAVQS